MALRQRNQLPRLLLRHVTPCRLLATDVSNDVLPLSQGQVVGQEELLAQRHIAMSFWNASVRIPSFAAENVFN
jgi:hypothetical protein